MTSSVKARASQPNIPITTPVLKPGVDVEKSNGKATPLEVDGLHPAARQRRV